jgi:hypothetical protein
VVKSWIPVIIGMVRKKPVIKGGIERGLRNSLPNQVIDVLRKAFLCNKSCLGCKAGYHVLETGVDKPKDFDPLVDQNDVRTDPPPPSRYS